MSTRKFGIGDLVSVWRRDSKRHKWLLEFSMVRVLTISADAVSVQTSDTWQQHRAPNGQIMQRGSCCLTFHGVGTWQRELRKAVLL